MTIETRKIEEAEARAKRYKVYRGGGSGLVRIWDTKTNAEGFYHETGDYAYGDHISGAWKIVNESRSAD